MTSKFSIDNRELLQRISSGEAVVGIDFGNLIVRELAAFRLAAMGSSESVELPLDYLQGHKDGLEWASQLAEANHPETGDWLYDDPIELAKAIRKGPDMPPSQPVADSEPVIVVGDDGGDALSYRRLIQSFEPGTKLYLHAQPAPVVQDEVSIFEAAVDECRKCDSIDEHAWNHGVLAVIAKFEACRAAMLQASNSPAQSDCCPAQNHVSPEQNSVSPAQSPIDHGYRPECECSGCKATARICAELSANSTANPDCWCRTCRPVTLNDMRFVVCPDCGNKRCPRANDHRNACTGSNEPGQEGSAYPAALQEVKQ
ncbi:hypothetical protein QQX85_03665 [Klebsiella variicola]|uniref:hypothetical protein n=1 Tax=Klebsiella variicola TaxID=244366 RepID=UPI00224F0DAF